MFSNLAMTVTSITIMSNHLENTVCCLAQIFIQLKNSLHMNFTVLAYTQRFEYNTKRKCSNIQLSIY